MKKNLIFIHAKTISSIVFFKTQAVILKQKDIIFDKIYVEPVNAAFLKKVSRSFYTSEEFFSNFICLKHLHFEIYNLVGILLEQLHKPFEICFVDP